MDSFGQDDSGFASSSSDSPDSLYSNGSPTFPTQSFEFDPDEVIQRDEEDDEAETAEAFDSPAWGKWPETATAHPGWSPAPSQIATPRKTIAALQISPRGSMSAARRTSLPRAMLEERRDSNPSLLGFELSQRRRSSIRSFSSARRRSSAFSSIMDPVEDARLRNIASMSSLGRRFSEVVEITCASSDSEEEHTAVARSALSRWSAESSDNESDYSEIMTASYAPTPEVSTIPSILSNFPLSSVARQPDTPSDMSASPIMPRFTRSRRQQLSTPSPEPNPLNVLRNRSRPTMARAVSEYQFPPKPAQFSIGVPPGVAPPKPAMNRAVSAPFLGSAQGRAVNMAIRAVPALFPILPLGTSPLREMVRRQSAYSDGESSRRPSVADRRASIGDRRTSLADRRTSLAKEARRESIDSRRGSLSKYSNGRKMSLPRKGSIASTRRSSKSSRKGSWVEEAAEFAYLAPEIVIDTPADAPSRANPPHSLSMPSFSFQNTAPNTPTPRFNPMESFLGTAASSPSTIQSPLTPFADYERTPTMSQSNTLSMLNRGRPVSPPEFIQSFPFWTKPPASPKSVPLEFKPTGILRKAVPKMSMEELSLEGRRDAQLRKQKETELRKFERRGASMFSPDEQALLVGAGVHRRTTSGNEIPKRPAPSRQRTLPVELDQSRIHQRRSLVMPSPLASSPEEPVVSKVDSKVAKRSSVTFRPDTATSTRPNMNRTSSFSRFFHHRSKSVVGAAPTKAVRPPARPISVDSSGSDRTLVEVREIFRKLGVSSPKRSSDEDDGKVPVSNVVLA